MTLSVVKEQTENTCDSDQTCGRIQHGEKTLPFSPGGFPLPPPTTHHLPPSAADPTFKSTPTKTNPRQTNKAGKR